MHLFFRAFETEVEAEEAFPALARLLEAIPSDSIASLLVVTDDETGDERHVIAVAAVNPQVEQGVDSTWGRGVPYWPDGEVDVAEYRRSLERRHAILGDASLPGQHRCAYPGSGWFLHPDGSMRPKPPGR